jgi:3-dehydro-L-gulonate 2-dehydrogenase
MSNSESINIPARQMQNLLYEVLLKNRVPGEKAATCSHTFTHSSLEGVYTHGINRFPRFVKYIQTGLINAEADPVASSSFQAIEQWDGRSGIGITNAFASTARAVELASQFGIGCVALRNTNHWMRAGTYARQAALSGCIFMGWSNTIRNMPAWGAKDPRLGNNPLTIGLPFGDSPVVLDMAMSQFSYGALDSYRMKNEPLPVPGGFDEKGNITTDPSEILNTRRVLPIGYWKGAGLSLLLDMLATILSGGLSVSEISKQPDETNLSQVFIAFNLQGLKNRPAIQDTLNAIIEDFRGSATKGDGPAVRYPGENVPAIRNTNLANGIPVSLKVWEEVLSLARQ